MSWFKEPERPDARIIFSVLDIDDAEIRCYKKTDTSICIHERYLQSLYNVGYLKHLSHPEEFDMPFTPENEQKIYRHLLPEVYSSTLTVMSRAEIVSAAICFATPPGRAKFIREMNYPPLRLVTN
jgi:hypothetical protein